MPKYKVPTGSNGVIETLIDRFVRYARIDTQSAEDTKTIPSTEGQWKLLRLLHDELQRMGARNLYLSPQGHLMATLPATVKNRDLPVLAFMAHVDTATEFPASSVKPLVHRKWNGKPIRLPDDRNRVLDPTQDPDLAQAIGKDLITASGKTLLGADDKAGVTIIMTLAEHLLGHPEIPHGPIRVCFLPDEEVGLRGASTLDLDKLGAHLAYTLDGKGVGEVVGESFSGDSATVTITGMAAHPGEARKRRMVNAVHLAGKLLAALPREFAAPETSEHYEGYLHPLGISGNAACTRIQFILRDFDEPGLEDKRDRLTGLCRGIQATEPRAKIQCEFAVSYRNMVNAFRQDRRPLDLALEAMRAIGIEPASPPIRGGTDGSLLSERGLPTPNLSCGEHNAHGPLEWVAAQEMEQMMNMCVELVQLWVQKGAGYRGYQTRQGRKR